MEKLPDPPERTTFKRNKGGGYHHVVTTVDLHLVRPCCDNCIHFAGGGKSRVYCTPCTGGPPIWHHKSDVVAASLHLIPPINVIGAITGRFSTTKPNFSEKPENKPKNTD